MADERTMIDPQQWRELMSPPHDALPLAWNAACTACVAVRPGGFAFPGKKAGPGPC